MKRRYGRRLVLNRETLRHLTDSDLTRAAGRAAAAPTDEPFCVEVLTYSDLEGPCTCPKQTCK